MAAVHQSITLSLECNSELPPPGMMVDQMLFW